MMDPFAWKEKKKNVKEIDQFCTVKEFKIKKSKGRNNDFALEVVFGSQL